METSTYVDVDLQRGSDSRRMRSMVLAVATVALCLIGTAIPASAHAAEAVGDDSQERITDPGGGGGTGNETGAIIACTVHTLKSVGITGWGVDYPKNMLVEIDQVVTINGKKWRELDTWVYTTRTGSWTVPTTWYPTLLNGTYKLVVRAYNDVNGKLLGSDSDTCKW